MDVTQQAFIKMFQHLGRFEIRDKTHIEVLLYRWIKKIVTNCSIDYLRRENRRIRGLAISELTKEYTDVTRSSDGKLLYEELVALISQLPPAYQRVFNLYVIEGYSHQDIAKLLKISSGTSKSNLSKARTHLQKHLGKI